VVSEVPEPLRWLNVVLEAMFIARETLRWKGPAQ
jgi:hypothetical protein